MKASEVVIGATYLARLTSGKTATVQIVRKAGPDPLTGRKRQGFHARNLDTGRDVYLKSPRKIACRLYGHTYQVLVQGETTHLEKECELRGEAFADRDSLRARGETAWIEAECAYTRKPYTVD